MPLVPNWPQDCIFDFVSGGHGFRVNLVCRTSECTHLLCASSGTPTRSLQVLLEGHAVSQARLSSTTGWGKDEGHDG
jgi:hypothetical protein